MISLLISMCEKIQYKAGDMILIMPHTDRTDATIADL